MLDVLSTHASQQKYLRNFDPFSFFCSFSHILHKIAPFLSISPFLGLPFLPRLIDALYAFRCSSSLNRFCSRGDNVCCSCDGIMRDSSSPFLSFLLATPFDWLSFSSSFSSGRISSFSFFPFFSSISFRMLSFATRNVLPSNAIESFVHLLNNGFRTKTVIEFDASSLLNFFNPATSCWTTRTLFSPSMSSSSSTLSPLLFFFIFFDKRCR